MHYSSAGFEGRSREVNLTRRKTPGFLVDVRALTLSLKIFE